MFSVWLVVGWLVFITAIVLLWGKREEIAEANRRYVVAHLPQYNRLDDGLDPEGIAFRGPAVIISESPNYTSGRYLDITWQQVMGEANAISNVMGDKRRYRITGVQLVGTDRYFHRAALLRIRLIKEEVTDG